MNTRPEAEKGWDGGSIMTTTAAAPRSDRTGVFSIPGAQDTPLVSWSKGIIRLRDPGLFSDPGGARADPSSGASSPSARSVPWRSTGRLERPRSATARRIWPSTRYWIAWPGRCGDQYDGGHDLIAWPSLSPGRGRATVKVFRHGSLAFDLGGDPRITRAGSFPERGVAVRWKDRRPDRA